jgi:hypothetical protein
MNEGDKMDSVVWSGTIFGQPYSVENRRKALAYYESALQQIEFERMALALPIESALELSGTIFCHSRRPDFVGCIGPICDVLQRGRIIDNDRAIKAINLRWSLDKKRPRAEIVLREWALPAANE